MPVIPDWVVIALAAWGVVSLALQLARALAHSKVPTPRFRSTLLLVHNQEEQIEGVIRLLSQGLPGTLVVVDVNSTDDTPRILERLVAGEPDIRLVRLSAEQAERACETGLFLCRDPLTLVLDLRTKVDARKSLSILGHRW